MAWKPTFSSRLGIRLACLTVAVAGGWFLRTAYDHREPPKKLIDIPRAPTSASVNTWEPVLSRLPARVQARNGVFIVHDVVIEQIIYARHYALHGESPWTVGCGHGLSVVFGGRVEVDIAAGMIDRENCAVLEPEVDERLRSILKDG